MESYGQNLMNQDAVWETCFRKT